MSKSTNAAAQDATITTFIKGNIEVVVRYKRNHLDGFRYPVFDLKPARFSSNGKRISGQDHYFDYETDEIIAAAKDAGSFITEFKRNPDAALERLERKLQVETPKEHIAA